MGRAIEELRVAPEDLLRAVAVMHVPIDDRNPLRAMQRCAWRAAMAALLNRQKPMAVAVRHGGLEDEWRRRRSRLRGA